MPIYDCKPCDFYTANTTDLERHKNTKKHKSIIDLLKSNTISATKKHKKCEKKIESIDSENSDSENSRVLEDANNNLIKCTTCGKKFTTKRSMYRHNKQFCKVKNQQKINDTYKKVEEKDKYIEKLEKEMREFQTEYIKKLEHDKEKLEKDKEDLIDITKKVSTVTKTAESRVSAMTYVNQHFTTAPPLKRLEGIKLNKLLEADDESESTFEEDIIYYYDNKELHKFLGNIIISEYKKDDPKKQSWWSSDIARLIFFIRGSMDGCNTWVRDKNGVNLIKLIISPLTKKVKHILQDFLKKCHKKNQLTSHVNYDSHCSDDSNDSDCDSDNSYENSSNDSDLDQDEKDTKVKTRLERMHKIVEVVKKTKLCKLNLDILRYIAPHFGIDISSSGCRIDWNNSDIDSDDVDSD